MDVGEASTGVVVQERGPCEELMEVLWTHTRTLKPTP